MVRGLVDGGRADMARARWADSPGLPGPGAPGAHCTTSSSGSRTSPRRSASGAGCSGRLGYRLGDDWGHGQAWELGALYIVIESGPDVARGRHDRAAPGLNHLAFHAGSRGESRPWSPTPRGWLDADVRRPSSVRRRAATTTPPTSRTARVSRSSWSPADAPTPCRMPLGRPRARRVRGASGRTDAASGCVQTIAARWAGRRCAALGAVMESCRGHPPTCPSAARRRGVPR